MSKRFIIFVLLTIATNILMISVVTNSTDSFELEEILKIVPQVPIITNFETKQAVLIYPKNSGCYIASESQMTKLISLKNLLNFYYEESDVVNEISNLCLQLQGNNISNDEFIYGVRDSAILIYPGTKWCGAGNRAANLSDLGSSIETDKCCRAHDTCKEFINGFSCHEKIEGFCNNSPFTRSSCSCDDSFRNCLVKANESVSTQIGTLFFTIFGMKCYRSDFPILGCLEYGGFLNLHCQKYELDYNGEKSFQFFDSPKFNSDWDNVTDDSILDNYFPNSSYTISSLLK